MSNYEGSEYKIVGYRKNGSAIYAHVATPAAPAPPAPPAPVSAPVRFETKAAEAAKAKDRLRTNRKTSKNKTKLGIGKTNIQPLNTGVLKAGQINY